MKYSTSKHISTVHERKKEESSFTLKKNVELNSSQSNPNSNFDSTDLQKHIPTVHDWEKKNQLLEYNNFILSNHVEYIKLLKIKPKNKLGSCQKL